MSRLTDQLDELGRAAPSSLGFGPRPRAERRPAMLLIGAVTTAGLGKHAGADGVDALVVTDGESLRAGSEAVASLDGSIWGVVADAPGSEGLDGLREAGCDFVLPRGADGPAVVMRDDGMARGFQVDTGLDEDTARALEFLPIDFLVLDAPPDTWPLKVAGLVKLQATVSLVSTHIVLRVDAAPEADELVVLRDLPVDALLVDLEAMPAEEMKKVRSRLDDLPPRRPRQGGHTDAVLPQAQRQGAGHRHDEEWDDDWDE